MMHKKLFQVGGIDLEFNSEIDIKSDTFAPKFKLFEIDEPGHDKVVLNHYFNLPEINEDQYEKEVYRKSPWIIYKNGDQWIYILETSPDPEIKEIRQISFLNKDHTFAEIYNGKISKEAYLKGGLGALTLAPTDQILLARLLAERNGCFLHSDGMKINEQGYLFVGHSGAGKSTIATSLKDRGEILCDDRMILRKWDNGYYIHGNWSHGTLPIVSSANAPLKGIFFLEQSKENEIVPVDSSKESITKILSCMIKPMVSKDWWNSMFDLTEDIVKNVSCYRLKFDKSGKIYDKLMDLD